MRTSRSRRSRSGTRGAGTTSSLFLRCRTSCTWQPPGSRPTPPARPRQATHLAEPLSQVPFPEAATEKPEGRYDVIAGVINERLLRPHSGQTPLAGHGLSSGQRSGGLALGLQCSAPPPLGTGYVPAVAIPQSPWPPVSFMILSARSNLSELDPCNPDLVLVRLTCSAPQSGPHEFLTYQYFFVSIGPAGQHSVGSAGFRE